MLSINVLFLKPRTATAEEMTGSLSLMVVAVPLVGFLKIKSLSTKCRKKAWIYWPTGKKTLYFSMFLLKSKKQSLSVVSHFAYHVWFQIPKLVTTLGFNTKRWHHSGYNIFLFKALGYIVFDFFPAVCSLLQALSMVLIWVSASSRFRRSHQQVTHQLSAPCMTTVLFPQPAYFCDTMFEDVEALLFCMRLFFAQVTFPPSDCCVLSRSVKTSVMFWSQSSTTDSFLLCSLEYIIMTFWIFQLLLWESLPQWDRAFYVLH